MSEFGGLHLEFEDEVVRICRARNAYVSTWRRSPTVEHLDRVGEVAAAVRSTGRAGLGNVVRPGPGERVRFSPEVREAAARLGRASRGQLGAAHVIEVGGLVGAATRAFLSTNALLTRTGTPERVFDTIEAAAPWWTARLNEDGPVWTEAEVLGFLRAAAHRAP